MKIILISGKAEHGKDYTAKLIKEELEKQNKKVVTVHFGDLVKFICEKYFDWDGRKDEKGRSILQFVGTDRVRKYNENYWVDFVKEVLTIFYGEWDYVIIPDCRFHNEVDWGDNWNTTTLRVNRLNFESSLTEEQKNHISEIALDNYEFDYVLNSESGIDNLKKEVDKFIAWMEV